MQFQWAATLLGFPAFSFRGSVDPGTSTSRGNLFFSVAASYLSDINMMDESI